MKISYELFQRKKCFNVQLCFQWLDSSSEQDKPEEATKVDVKKEIIAPVDPWARAPRNRSVARKEPTPEKR